jgi:hypothetical protein
MFYHPATAEQRGELLRIIFDQLKMSGRLQPSVCFGLSWETLEEEARLRFCNSETFAH